MAEDNSIQPFRWTSEIVDRVCQAYFPEYKVRRLWTRDGEYVTVRKNRYNTAYIYIYDDRVYFDEEFVEGGGLLNGWAKRTTSGDFYERIEAVLNKFQEKPNMALLANLKDSPRKTLWNDHTAQKWNRIILWSAVVYYIVCNYYIQHAHASGISMGMLQLLEIIPVAAILIFNMGWAVYIMWLKHKG